MRIMSDNYTNIGETLAEHAASIKNIYARLRLLAWVSAISLLANGGLVWWIVSKAS